jgi:Phage integrase, N-terminal SAM-like domain
MVQSHGTPSQPKPPRLLEQVREAIRVRHYSLRTEETYVGWIKRFILFHGKRHPRDMGVQGGPAVPVTSGRSRACRRLHTKSGVECSLVSVPAGPQAGHGLAGPCSAREAVAPCSRGIDPGRGQSGIGTPLGYHLDHGHLAVWRRPASPGVFAPAGERC